MLELKNYTKIYANKYVGAKNISLKVENGDIFAFIGHNGAGKTTTIKSIVGINDITSGDIFVNNISVKENPNETKKILAYVPDNPDLYDSLTGIQFLNFIADIFKIEKKKREALILKYSNLLGLASSLNDFISTYSHGMKQKLVLISALIHEPKILILDEPFVGLDPKASFELKNIMKEFASGGGAIFFSTHVLDVAEKICNKVAIIKKGEIIAQGKMADIKKDKSLESVFLELTNE